VAGSTKLTLLYEKQYGRMTITNDAQEFVVWHSTVLSPEALVLLCDAVCNLLAGRDHATCPWEEEPGQFRWLLERQGERVAITILWFRDAFSRLPDERGEAVFSIERPLHRLAVQVKNLPLTEINNDRADHYLASALKNLNAMLQRHKIEQERRYCPVRRTGYADNFPGTRSGGPRWARRSG